MNKKTIFKMIDLVIILMGTLLLYPFVVLVSIAFPFAGLLAALRSKSKGVYINNYFVYSKKRNGEYELHYQPLLVFSWTNKSKFLLKREHAIKRLTQHLNREGISNPKIIGRTMTLNKLIESNEMIVKVICEERREWLVIISSLLITVTNVRNIASLSLSYKVFNIIIVNKFIQYEAI